MNKHRPYIISPHIVEQPTWGGNYIAGLKKLSGYQGKKIGQSFELFGGSRLFLHADDSAKINMANDETLPVTDFVPSVPLIKLTQAAGNSFQLHVRPGVESARWQPKPESWYYFEDGLATYGLKENADIKEYKKTCLAVEAEMARLSKAVVGGRITMEEAKTKAGEYISKNDPHEFVNVIVARKGQLLDLSPGGLHHSWEEDRQRFPLGNVLYEVQVDVADEYCTIRSFDQGKIKDDGMVRPLDIEDYFRYIDADPERNSIESAITPKRGNTVIATPYYRLDSLAVSGKTEDYTDGSFSHLFVKEGNVRVAADGGEVVLTQGWSCFVPAEAKKYTIDNLFDKPSIVLKTV